MPLEFTMSDALTFGVELELMVLNTRDFNLTRGAPDLLSRLAKAQLPSEVKPEITESMIEVNSTGAHALRGAARRAGAHARRHRATRPGRLNLAVAGGGSHPFHQWSDRRIFPTERFLKVSALYGYLAKQFTVFGQHIHIGVESGDDAVYLTHQMARYIPHFIALSASSPFYQGEDTSFETSRLHAVSAFPLAGHLPAVALVGRVQPLLRRDGGLRHRRQHEGLLLGHPPQARVRHDRDPHRRHAAHRHRRGRARRLRADARRGPAARPPRRTRSRRSTCVYGYNRFQACRFGFEAMLADPGAHTHIRLREDLHGHALPPAAHRRRAGHGRRAARHRRPRRPRAERQPLAARALRGDAQPLGRGAPAGGALARRPGARGEGWSPRRRGFSAAK